MEEYRTWLKENANKEERQAYKVAELIVDYHTINRVSDYKIDIFPRKKINGIEFDLLIYIWVNSRDPEKRRYWDTLIGIEFKETDMDKVLKQAIIRREFVDYMYIATNCRAWEIEQLFLIALYGIGWIYWDNNFIKMILAPKRHVNRVGDLINYLLDRKLEEIVEETVDRKIQTRLEEWLKKS
ncbi:MAG: hypothetical protein DRN18_03165 [Thermoplasmata archaeon]|nr:MAG: hypothetical protein DRN18_03165 [Thermoplasmata archaeon]